LLAALLASGEVVADDLINLVEVERVERAGLLRRARTCFAAIVTR
jgi:hypothetical protein